MNAALLTAESREEIEQAVCDQFAGGGPYRFAWMGRLDRGHRHIVPRAWAGVEKGYLDTLEIPLDEGPAAKGPAARAVQSSEVQTVSVTDPMFEPWREHARERGYEAVIVIPVIYDQTTYGVLAMYAGTPEETEYLDEAVLAELGRTVGYAINAVERKQALMVDSVLELDFEIRDSTEFFCRFSASVGGTVVLEKVTLQNDGSYTLFLTIETTDADHVEAVCERFQSIDTGTLLTDRSEECVVELRVRGSLVVDLLAAHGSAVRSLTATDGTCELTIELPTTSDVRSLVEMLESAYNE